MRKFTASLLALVCLALCVPDASAGCRLFQRLRDRHQQRQDAPQQAEPQSCAPQAVTTLNVYYDPALTMPSPSSFGIALPASSPGGCANGSCSAPRGLFRR